MTADIKNFRFARKRRSKVKGRKSGGRFVGIPQDVVDSVEFGTLSAHATKLLIELARQYRGQNNGDFSAAFSQLKKRGWRSPSTLNRAKKELTKTGFVIVTLQGGRHRCSLYALTWLAIDECNGKHHEPATIVPSHLWRKAKPLVPISTNVVPIGINRAVEEAIAIDAGPDVYESH